MSDVKNATIIPYWKVLARFGAHIFPRGDMHTCCYCETFDEAQDAMDTYVKCGSYSEVRVVQCDMAYVGGLTQGLAADSAGSRPALADYIVVFKKPGENSNPIRAGISERYDNREGWITGDEWCEWAAPVWYRKMPAEKSPHYPFQGNYPSRHQDTDGINEGDVLRNFTEGRESDDEKHLCPLQLGVIERCVKLWSNPDDVVLSPFMGIGSEGYVAIRHNRRFIGCELKPSYFRVACANLRDAERRRLNVSDDLFGNVADAEIGK